jgi:hypothetical protein
MHAEEAPICRSQGGHMMSEVNAGGQVERLKIVYHDMMQRLS